MMLREELIIKLDSLSREERDSLDLLIIGGEKVLESKDRAALPRLADEGLIARSHGFNYQYCAGPLSHFFDYRLQNNFA